MNTQQHPPYLVMTALAFTITSLIFAVKGDIHQSGAAVSIAAILLWLKITIDIFKPTRK